MSVQQNIYEETKAQFPEGGTAEQIQRLIKDYILGTEGERHKLKKERQERVWQSKWANGDGCVIVGGSNRAVHHGLATPHPAQSVTQQFQHFYYRHWHLFIINMQGVVFTKLAHWRLTKWPLKMKDGVVCVTLDLTSRSVRIYRIGLLMCSL